MLWRLARLTRAYREAASRPVYLTQEEIDVLGGLLWLVSGSPAGPRGVVASVLRKLETMATPTAERSGRCIVYTGSVCIEKAP